MRKMFIGISLGAVLAAACVWFQDVSFAADAKQTNAPPVITHDMVFNKFEQDKEKMFKLGAGMAVKIYGENPLRFQTLGEVVEAAWAKYKSLMALDGEEFTNAVNKTFK